VNVLGIDPATARGVIWYRPDFADRPLGQLLTVIARPGPNAIVSDTFLSATGLHVGDAVDVTLYTNRMVHLRVAAVAHFFATLDPNDNPFMVTNLTYLEKASKSPGPSEVWLATDHNQGVVARLVDQARQWPRRILDYEGLASAFSAQDEPLTAGIYGVVSVGFLIAVALALLGFFAYAYLSLQRRLSEFAIVRALGLSSGQLRLLLLCEQFFVVGAGILGGIAAGVLTTKLFLPYMPFATNTVPPFLVVMPWVAVAEFIAAVLVVFLVVLSGHVYMLLRLQLGRVLRLGEA
jgi:putative ABC transport system permease protein